MKKTFFSCLALTIAVLTQAGVQQTTVFSLVGNETATETKITSQGVQLGTPAVTFKSNHITYVGDQANDPTVSTDNYIRIPNKQVSTSTSGRNMMMGNLSGYSVPFDTMLNKIDADSIEWSFIVRYNYGTATNGFGRGKRGVAIILAMDGEDTEKSNGYAVVSMGKKKYGFARITNGLDTTANVDTLVTMPISLSDFKVPVTMKVVYVPSTNEWKFYYINSTATDSYILPSEAEYIYAGSVIDATHTGKKMKSFGFYNCYAGASSIVMFVRHFSVKTYTDPFKSAYVESNIYNTTFTAETKTMMNGTSKGTPSVTYTHTPIATAGDAPAEPSCKDYLTIGKPGTKGAQGRNILTAPLANFAAPFTAKLSEIKADSIAWAFNMRNNREYKCTGLNDGKNGYAVALVASSADLTTGCGYALVMGDEAIDGSPSKKYRLVRYNDGLTANGKTNKIVLSDTISLRAYTSVRVVYVPTTNTWKLYTYYGGSTFVKPSESAYKYNGSAVDATYTSTDMTAFGFMANYTGMNNGALFIKNFSLSAYFKQDTISESIDNSALLTAKDGMVTNVALQRTLKGGMWNTFCVPFDMTAEQVATTYGEKCKLAKLNSATVEGETLSLDFDDAVTSVEAGVPYLIKPYSNVNKPRNLFEVTLSAEAQTIDKTLAQMTGIFSPTQLEASINTLYLGLDNTLYYVSETSTLSGLRAYFTLSGEAAKATQRRVSIGGKQIATDLVSPNENEQGIRKMIKDGQLIIIREGEQYNAQGVRF